MLSYALMRSMAFIEVPIYMYLSIFYAFMTIKLARHNYNMLFYCKMLMTNSKTVSWFVIWNNVLIKKMFALCVFTVHVWNYSFHFVCITNVYSVIFTSKIIVTFVWVLNVLNISTTLNMNANDYYKYRYSSIITCFMKKFPICRHTIGNTKHLPKILAHSMNHFFSI